MKKIMIVAGEPSGDLNGSSLVSALKRREPGLEISGIGGGRMEAAGVFLHFNMEEMAVVGFSEVFRNLNRFRRIFTEFCRIMEAEKPDALILLDYPGFNMRLAQRARAKGIRVFYYVSPQVWAWGKNRVFKIAASVDKMLVIFPFEKKFYEKYGIEAEYVGHPVIDRIKFINGGGQSPAGSHLRGSQATVCFLPGSRMQEVRRHLPVMLKAGALMKARLPGLRFIIGRAETISEEFIENISEKYPLRAEVVKNEGCRAAQASDMVIASSGTATVEAAYFKKPMVVLYKTSFITWIIAKAVVRIENIAMVNVLAGRRIVPELVQFRATARNVAEEALGLLRDGEALGKMADELEKVKNMLGGPGASERAASLILEAA